MQTSTWRLKISYFTKNLITLNQHVIISFNKILSSRNISVGVYNKIYRCLHVDDFLFDGCSQHVPFDLRAFLCSGILIHRLYHFSQPYESMDIPTCHHLTLRNHFTIAIPLYNLKQTCVCRPHRARTDQLNYTTPPNFFFHQLDFAKGDTNIGKFPSPICIDLL